MKQLIIPIKIGMSQVIDMSLEGIIGVGKTTLTHRLKEVGIEVHGEPLDVWSDVKYTDPISGEKKTINVFENYYNNPKAYSASFQTFTFQTRRMGKDRPQKCVRERSIVGDMMFGAANYLLGNMDEVQYACYSFIAEDELKRHDNPTAYVYVYAPVDVCMERIHRRNRGGESTIDESYLQLLERLHNTYFLRNISDGKHYIVDGSHDVNSPEYNQTLCDITAAFEGNFSGLERQTEILTKTLSEK
jgi:deoxyadenosine/deoxycytidine kinase